jgi:glutaredoxin-like protein NrdH
MDNEITFTFEEGDNDFGDLALYALSTCGFCKQAMAFLKEKSIRFKYVFVDELEPQIKFSLKGELEKKYKLHVSYPFLTLDDEKSIVGFFKSDWEKKFSG